MNSSNTILGTSNNKGSICLYPIGDLTNKKSDKNTFYQNNKPVNEIMDLKYNDAKVN